MPSNTNKKRLIDGLIAQGYLKTPRIINAFKAIDRKHFVRNSEKSRAYANHPLPIGHGQTISQPLTVAFMLEKLQPEPGDKILDIGSGSGWSTALLAYCTGIEPQDDTGNDSDDDNPRQSASTTRNNSTVHQRQSASIYAIERIPELCRFGHRNTSKYFKTNNHCYDISESSVSQLKKLPSNENSQLLGNEKLAFIGESSVEESPPVLFFCGDAAGGLSGYKPYDKIIAAASTSEVPPAWKKQLKVGGILVFPMPGALWRYTKKSKGEFKKEKFPGFTFVRLRTDNTDSR